MTKQTPQPEPVNYTEISLLELAQRYAFLGWHVFPVHGINSNHVCTCGSRHSFSEEDLKKKGKHPAIEKWQELATNDFGQLENWWKENPDYNIAVVCNRSGLVVLDVDPRNGGLESLDKLEVEMMLDIPKTAVSVTGSYLAGNIDVRGLHYFFRAPIDSSFKANLHSKIQNDDLPGIDIKHNGYVILPGSRHFSGVKYEWKTDSSPWEQEVSLLEGNLLDLLRKNRVSSGDLVSLISAERMNEIRHASSTTTAYGAKALSAEILEIAECPEGNRNNQLFISGVKIGSLIAGGHISWGEGVDALICAGNSAGLASEEIEQVLLREGGALMRGLSSPRGPKPLDKALIDWAIGQFSPEGLPRNDDEVQMTILHRANILDWQELYSGALEEEEWLVPGFICSERGHSLYSDAGLGKSLLMREIGACLASGKSAVGLPPKEPMNVLYLDFENNPYGDITRSLKEMGFEASELEGFKVSSFPEFDPFDTERGGNQVMELVKLLNPRLVVIDTVSRVIEGDENSNDTWIKFFNYLGQKLKKEKVAYVRLDHEGKNNSNGARGGSAKRGDVDFVWHYTKANGKFKLTNEKSRIPLTSNVIFVIRQTEPVLNHRLDSPGGNSENSWGELIEQANKFVTACRLIKENFDVSKKIPGQKYAWSQISDQCQKLAITRENLSDAIRFLKDDELSEITLVEIM